MEAAEFRKASGPGPRAPVAAGNQLLERVAAGLLSLASARAVTACGLPAKELPHRVHVISQGFITVALQFGLRGALDIWKTWTCRSPWKWRQSGCEGAQTMVTHR